MGTPINPNFKPLTKLEVDTIKKIRKEYKEALNEIRLELSKLDEKGLLTTQELNKYKRQRALEYRILTLLDGTYKRSFKDIKASLSATFQESFYLTAFALDSGIETKLDFTLLRPEVIANAIQNPISGTNATGQAWELGLRAGEKRNALINRINSGIVQGLRRGDGYGAIAREMTGLMDNDFKRTIRIVNTETHRVQELGRYQAEQRADELGVNMVKVWVSTLDKKTRDAHQDLDGKKVPFDGEFVSRSGGRGLFAGSMNNAGDDINCRCTHVVEVEGFEYGSRAQRNSEGYTDTISNMDYNEWKKTLK